MIFYEHEDLYLFLNFLIFLKMHTQRILLLLLKVRQVAEKQHRSLKYP